MTPTIPRSSSERATLRESLHRKSKSMPAGTPATPAEADDAETPTTPLSLSSEGNIDRVSPLLPDGCAWHCARTASLQTQGACRVLVVIFKLPSHMYANAAYITEWSRGASALI